MKVGLVLLLCLLLAACDASAPYADPNLAAQDAKATIGAATAIAQSTQDEQRRVEREATREAARTREASEAEIAAIEAQIRGTEVAIQAIQTMDAHQFAALQSTQQVYATQTAWPQTATPLAATQAAVVARASYEDARADLGVAADIIKFIAALAIIAWTAATIVKAFTNRYRVANTIFGVVSFDPGVQMLTANVAPATPPTVNAKFREIPDVVSLNRSGTVLSSPTMSHEERARQNLINLLKVAILIKGEDAQQLPRWNDIPGMNSEKMQRYVGILEQMGLFSAVPYRGTFTEGGRSLKEVLYELQTNQVPHFSPDDGG